MNIKKKVKLKVRQGISDLYVGLTGSLYRSYSLLVTIGDLLYTRNTKQWIEDYQGNLIAVENNVPAMKGGRLARTLDEGAILGEEIIINGDFSNGTSDWLINETAGNTVDVVDGVLKIEVLDGVNNWCTQVFDDLQLRYVTFDYTVVSGIAGIEYDSDYSTDNLYPGGYRFEKELKCNGFKLKRVSNCEAYFDNVSVKEIIPTWQFDDHLGNPLLPKADYPTQHSVNTEYQVGDKVLYGRFGLTCVEAGFTDSVPPTILPEYIGLTGIDGEVMWMVDGYATLEGIQLEKALTNKCGCSPSPLDPVGTKSYHNGTAWVQDVSGFILAGGPGHELEVVDDAVAIEASGLKDVSPDLKAYKITFDPSSSFQYVSVNGTTGNQNSHSASVYARTESIDGQANLVYINTYTEDGQEIPVSDTYQKVKIEDVIPVNTARKVTFFGRFGGVMYFLAPQLVEDSFASSLIASKPIDYGPATRDLSVLKKINNLPDNDFSFDMYVIPIAPQRLTERYLLSSFLNYSNFFAVTVYGNIFRMTKKIDGNIYVTSNAIFDYSVGDVLRIKGIVSSARGLELSVNKVVGTHINTDDCVKSDHITIGSMGNSGVFQGNYPHIGFYNQDQGSDWLTED